MQFNESATKVFAGIALVIVAVIFLLSGTGLLYLGYAIFSDQLDIIFAFCLLALGLALIFSNVAKKE
jgi:uncharacterized membrane protein YfcA